MNKKLILLIIGLLLILLGLLGWNNFKKANNIDNEMIEELNNIPAQEETVQKEEVVEEETETAENIKKEVKTENKSTAKQNISKPVEVKTVKPAEETKVFEESVLETKTLPDPYVDENGNIVVQNEFRPHLKDKIFFRGVVYTIKTKLAPAEEKKN